MNLRDLILNAPDPELHKEDVPEWKCAVYIKVMNGVELEQFHDTYDAKDATRRAKLLVRTLCDETGNLLFTPAEVKTLSEKCGYVLERLFSAALKHNHLGSAAEENTKKNSSGTEPASS